MMIGRTISHYQIIEKIGEGGMGVVYKARDTHLDRFVAIKVLPPEKVADPGRKARFVREAKSASALNHPNIVHVYDIDQQDDIEFMAMEFVAGKTLSELIPRKGIPLKEALRIAIQVADALAAAHEVGIVHRDLKPGNILVDDDGRVRVLDFGLAKLTEAIPETAETRTAVTNEAPQTEEGSILGTASYMSPEQAEGRAVDARSDIFSFGSLLYEMVTSRRAFQGDSRMSTLAAIIKEEPKSVREIVGDVPGEVERIIRHCLRKDPKRRLQHMDDVRSLLEELKEESDSGRLAPAAPGVPQVKGRRVGWVAGVVAVALFVVVGFYWFERSRSRVQEAPLVAVPLTSYPGNELTPALSPDGNQVVFSWDGEAQDNYDIYVQVIGAGGTVRLTSDPAFDWAPAWSPDGREIRFYRYWREGRFAVVSVPPLPGRERTLREYPFPPDLPRDVLLFAAPAWSPNGKCTAHPGESGLVLRPANGTVRTVADLPGGSELSPSFSPDGRSLAFVYQTGGANTDLYLLPLTPDFQADGKPKRLTSGMRFINRPVWTPDSREMIFSAATETGMGLWRIEASGASAPRRLVLAAGDAWSPSISRDGRRLVYERRMENSSIWRVGLGRQSHAAESIISSTRIDALPSYSPDGTKIAFSSYRTGSLEIWMADADGSSPVQLTSLEQYSVVPEWSPDGKRIVFQSSGKTGNHLYVVGAEGGGLRRLTEDADDALQPSWSPDGEWIYFMSDRSGAHQIWRVSPQGGQAAQVTRDGGEFARVSPDGNELHFTRGAYGSHELWKMAVTGGAATRLNVPPVYDWGFVIAGERLYFATAPEGGTYPIVSLDLRTGKTREVAKIAYSPFAKFSVSPDGQWLAYDQHEQSNSDLMLVENFR
jgi:Tol biopolymer transport system component/predicted Ser/Thr protein kinase